MKMIELLQKYRSVLIYLILGIMTTAVNYAVYLPLYNLCHLSATLSNSIAWVVAVVFAFLTNKPLAFESHDWSLPVIVKEFLPFLLCRVGTGVLETLCIFTLVDCMQLNGNIIKVIVSVAVVIANYFGSKLLVFRK